MDGWMLTERNDEKRGRLSLLTQLRHSSSSLWAAQSRFQLVFSGTGAVRERRRRPDESRRLKSPQVDPSVIKKNSRKGLSNFLLCWGREREKCLETGFMRVPYAGVVFIKYSKKKKSYPNLSTVVALTAYTHVFFVLLFLFPPWLSVSAS